MTTTNTPPDDDPAEAETTGEAAGSGTSLASEKTEATAITEQPAAAKGALTREALDSLLARFSADAEEAAKLYLRKLDKLNRFFEWQGSLRSDLNAQETLDRVARKIAEGTVITNLDAYISSVARVVWKEEKRFQERERKMSHALPTVTPEPSLEDEESELRRSCLDQCLDELPPESRKLINDYFSEDGRAKIELRRQLAEMLGIGLNALRIRVHRLEKELKARMDRRYKRP